jgi:hypothetical protein
LSPQRKSRRPFQASELPIDIEHKRVLPDVLAGKADAELLFECAV